MIAILSLMLATTALAQDTDELPSDPIEPPPVEAPAVEEHAVQAPVVEAPAPETAQPVPPPEVLVDEAPIADSPESSTADADSALTRKGEKTLLEDDREVEVILEAPTRSIEAYEKLREERLLKAATPSWGASLVIAPRSFHTTEFRVPYVEGEEDPALTGILASIERLVVRTGGILSVGAAAGGYISGPARNFDGLGGGFWSVGPYLQYQAHYFARQWLVPTLRAEYEFMRYSYLFRGNRVEGLSQITRYDLGLLFLLNSLERRAAAQMESNYGIKRTYLAAYYSVANDQTKEDFDLSENSYRVGLRFEF